MLILPQSRAYFGLDMGQPFSLDLTAFAGGLSPWRPEERDEMEVPTSLRIPEQKRFDPVKGINMGRAGKGE